MPRPVCVKCRREMTQSHAVPVQYNALSAGTAPGEQGPYQQWMGDLFRCSGCGIEIVSGFGRDAFWEQHHKPHAPPTVKPFVIVEERNGLSP